MKLSEGVVLTEYYNAYSTMNNYWTHSTRCGVFALSVVVNSMLQNYRVIFFAIISAPFPLKRIDPLHFYPDQKNYTSAAGAASNKYHHLE